MADPVARKLPLRHPAENPTFILMVVLNFAILAVLIDFLATAALIPPALRGTNWEATWRAVAAAIILVAPAILIVRQVQRASIRGTAVRLSRTQFPDLYASVDDFAATLSIKPTPAVYLSNGNGTLNAFAAQSGWTNNYVVLSNELFANLRNDQSTHGTVSRDRSGQSVRQEPDWRSKRNHALFGRDVLQSDDEAESTIVDTATGIQASA
jgi:Zn-dependent protease with chaperone function